MIYVPLPRSGYDCVLCLPVRWALRDSAVQTEEGTQHIYTVQAVGYMTHKGSSVHSYSSPLWVPLREFVTMDDASQLILDMQAGRWRVEQVQDWHPAGPQSSGGERVETVADMHRVVRGAGRAKYRRRRSP